MSLESALSAIGAWRFGPKDKRFVPAGRARGLRAGLLLMLAIGLVPALAGTALYLRQLRDLALRDAFNQADLMAVGTAERLRWLMQDAQAMLAAVAARPKVKALDAADCDPIFRDYRDLSPTFKALALRRLDGESVCSELPRPPSRQSVGAAEWFQAAVQQPGFYATSVHVGAVQQTWTSRLTFPVIGPSGRVEGLLITPVNLAQLRQRLFAKLPADALAAVVDGSNRVVARSQLHDDRVGKPAAERIFRMLDILRRGGAAEGAAPTQAMQFTEIGLDGARRLYVIRRVPMIDWAVVATLTEEQTLAGYYASRNRALAAIAATLALVALAAWRVSRAILVPIRGLTSAAQAVAAGDTTCRAAESGPREIAKVAHEFNRMLVAAAEAGEKLRASENHYRTLIQNLPVAVVAHRPDSSIEVFNDRACALLRMTPEQLTGKSAMDRAWHFVDDQGRRLQPSAYPVNRVLQTHQPMPATMLGIGCDGTAGAADGAPATGQAPHTWVLVTAYPQFEQPGALARAIVVFVDVTMQRQSEDLRVAKEAAEAASKAKSVFLSRVSHELRTPLNAINGFSELMLMDEQVPADSKDKLRLVLDAGQHLLSLINQILDLTRIESGAVRAALQPVCLWPLVQACVAICAPLAQARGVTLVVLPPALDGMPADRWQVLGDETPLRQVLINLLSNAIKYNRPDGQVTVAVELRSPAGSGSGPDVVVTVTDTGRGLTPAQVDALFQPFNRLGAEYSGIEGHGLGLSISHALAQAMSGDITVHSVEGQGSTFALHLHGCRTA